MQISVKTTLPSPHADQRRAYNMPGRFRAIRCGRRWGKTVFGAVIAAEAVIYDQHAVGWFAPDYRRLTPAYTMLLKHLAPIKSQSSFNKSLACVGGGNIDFWSLGDPLAGRGQEYDIVIIDEAAFAPGVGGLTMMDIYQQAIEPTLLIRQGRVIAMSNASGIDPTNFFFQICNDYKITNENRPDLPAIAGSQFGFMEYHAPSRNNPLVPEAEIESLRATRPPLVFAQEYEAEFVDWSGTAFFELEKLYHLGEPVDVPKLTGSVYVTIDTATKTGKDNDGTAVIYWALTPEGMGPHRLTILDWDLVQIEGSLLETWLPTIFQNLQGWATQCRAIHGSAGALIEDKSSGMVLLQQAARRGWPARAIDSKLTAMGKSERAISISGYHYQGKIKITRPARDKVTMYKGVSRNHLLGQVLGFRVGDKDPNRPDDLLDAYTYGVIVGLGNQDGY